MDRGTVMIGDFTADSLARVLKALADATRLQIIALLAASPNGEMTVGEVGSQMHLSQTMATHHLLILHKAGLLKRERLGVYVYYSINKEALVNPVNALLMFARKPTELKQAKAA